MWNFSACIADQSRLRNARAASTVSCAKTSKPSRKQRWLAAMLSRSSAARLASAKASGVGLSRSSGAGPWTDLHSCSFAWRTSTAVALSVERLRAHRLHTQENLLSGQGGAGKHSKAEVGWPRAPLPLAFQLRSRSNATLREFYPQTHKRPAEKLRGLASVWLRSVHEEPGGIAKVGRPTNLVSRRDSHP